MGERGERRIRLESGRSDKRNLDRMDSMPSVMQQTQVEVEQLRREAAMKRVPVSQAVEDIKRFALENMMQDHLIIGFPSEKSNPFRKKRRGWLSKLTTSDKEDREPLIDLPP